MSDFAVAVIALAVFVVAVWAIVKAYNARLAARSSGRRWRLEERSRNGEVTVHVIRAGDEPLLVGAVAWDAEDFETRIEEIRSVGRARLTALNAG